ncbi:MAG: hypothetical protein R3200_15550 [Xanthomonadales bacterium]|nr:hypothetical protein [Xanthomonadales bacterium]
MSDPGLALYTEETRRQAAGWTLTPAQMDTVVESYRSCSGETRFSADGRRAVIRYPVATRHCAPWFLVRGTPGWLLDLATMHQVIGFGRNNAWRLAGDAGDYAFAFADWRFDRHGFPVVAP